MNAKNLCLKLVKAESEEEIISILTSAGYWDNPSAWREFNDDENNYSTIGNQSSKADAALVEKLINSVDAMLMGAALENASNKAELEDKRAPQSIDEAVEKYFNVKHGKLAYLSGSERSNLAENIHLVATGAKQKPCYSIIDKGEGQTPNSMLKTILAISKTNKLRIPFVQGKFHMGGTGALRFCGKHNIQLIISKKNPKITIAEDSTQEEWGFTIIRRESPETIRSSVYTYLAPETNKTLLHFQADSLPLLPGTYPEAYSENLEYGTFVKLFEYDLRGLKTVLTLDAYYRLSVLLPSLALPIRFAERRKGYKAHSYESTLAGLRVRLDDDRNDAIEENFPTSHEIKVLGEKMRVMVYAFKKGKAGNYKKSEGAIFTINGQTHGNIDDRLFARKRVGMSYLADSILVIGDCSGFSNRAREDLFMNSRDRLSQDCELRTAIERELESLIAHHDGLRELRNKRRQEEITKKLTDSKPFIDLLNKALKFHPSLSFLLGKGKKVTNPFQLEPTTSGKKEYKGKQFPTYFNIKKSASQEKLVKRCPINKKFRIQFETDVTNDYFSRDEYPGDMQVSVAGHETDNYTVNLWEGMATLNVKLPSDVQPGDLLEYKVIVSDETQLEPFTNEFQIICEKEEEKKKVDGGDERKKPRDDQGDEEQKREKEGHLAIPPITPVHKDEWGDHGFDQWSALKIKDNGQGSYDFYINVHNTHLLNEIKAQTSKDAKLLEAQFKYGLVLIAMALVKENGEPSEINGEKDIEKEVFEATKAIAPVILPIIDTLGEIEITE